ncbi:sugar phosphate isomerase/epimerase family protein [Butyricicoccus sp.]|uniref:sugar phosphate isomerase/epimerase family protein n=1 Tax=Butyricicoccus sp. TaxID=2049021 RepID=UPI003F14FE50
MAIKTGIAPDSWGVWFPEHEKQPQWWRCLDEMKVAGYEGCEIGPWGYMPNEDPKVLKHALEARGLTLVGATEGGNYLDDVNVEQMLKDIDDIAALLKHFPSAKYIVLLPPMYTNLETGELEMNPELTEEEWAKYCANVQKCADRCAEHGLEGLFHPHVDSHVQTEAQIDRFLQDTTVNLCFDTGHHVYGGGEPISYYKKHADRIPYIHLKDCDLAVKAKMDENKWSFAKAVTEDIMVEPGKGSIDFAVFHQALVDAGYDGWCVVEQDLFPVKSFDVPLEKAAAGRENLRKAGF